MSSPNDLTIPAGTGPSFTPYVMIVESDPDVATMLQSVLRTEMHQQTLLATSMENALHLTDGLRPLLFLINEYLSDGDGITLYDQLQSNLSLAHIPAILLTTNFEECQPKAQVRNITCLSIPVELDELIQAIEQLMQTVEYLLPSESEEEILTGETML